MANRLRVGLVGCGRIGAFTRDSLRATLARGWLPVSHAEAVVSEPDLELVALCDENADGLRAAMERYRVSAGYADYREMILKERLDILTIATRMKGRVEMLKFAAGHCVRGVHFEKPLAASVHEASAALDALKSHGVHMTYGALRRYMEVYREAKARADAFEIGKLKQIRFSFGETMLLWAHAHSTDLMLFFAGDRKVEFVQAHCSFECEIKPDIIDADPVVHHVLVKFDDGLLGVIDVEGGSDLTLSGEDGKIIVGGDGNTLAIWKKPDAQSIFLREQERTDWQAGISGRQMALRELVAALRIGRVTSVRAQEIETSQRLLMAIAYSAANGGIRVRLEDVPAGFEVTGRFGNLYP